MHNNCCETSPPTIGLVLCERSDATNLSRDRDGHAIDRREDAKRTLEPLHDATSGASSELRQNDVKLWGCFDAEGRVEI